MIATFMQKISIDQAVEDVIRENELVSMLHSNAKISGQRRLVPLTEIFPSLRTSICRSLKPGVCWTYPILKEAACPPLNRITGSRSILDGGKKS